MKATAKPDPYETLGVDKSATTDDIRRAHRKRIRKAHPDSGGNPEEFMHLQCAYETLIDPDKRRRYDNNEPEPGNIVHEAMSHLCKLFLLLVDSHADKITTIDIVSLLEEKIRDDTNQITALKNANNRKAKTLRKLMDRMKYNGHRVDVIGEMLKGQIRDLDQAEKHADRTIEMFAMASTLAKEYAFEREPSTTSSFAQQLYTTNAKWHF